MHNQIESVQVRQMELVPPLEMSTLWGMKISAIQVMQPPTLANVHQNGASNISRFVESYFHSFHFSYALAGLHLSLSRTCTYTAKNVLSCARNEAFIIFHKR